MPEYLVAPFNQPVWRGLKQPIHQESIGKKITKKSPKQTEQVAGLGAGWGTELPDIGVVGESSP